MAAELSSSIDVASVAVEMLAKVFHNISVNCFSSNVSGLSLLIGSWPQELQLIIVIKGLWSEVTSICSDLVVIACSGPVRKARSSTLPEL